MGVQEIHNRPIAQAVNDIADGATGNRTTGRRHERALRACQGPDQQSYGDQGNRTENPRSPAAEAAEQPKTALDALKVGNASLHSGNYTDAESNARFAIKTAHSVAGKMDAQFLLAQSLAGQKQYRQSAVAYYDAYTKAPKSLKAQDSLLGVAASMLALGDKGSACQALDKLKTEFPVPAPRVKTAETTFRSRAACH